VSVPVAGRLPANCAARRRDSISRVTVGPGGAQRIAHHSAVLPAPGPYIGPRARLIEAGRQLLAERGDTSYTIEDLVRRARVAIKTFYRSFPNKEEFLKAVFVTSVAGSVPRVRDIILAASDDPLERLRLAVTRSLEGDVEDAAGRRVLANEHMRIAATSPETIAETGRAYAGLIRELLVDAAAAGLVHPVDLDWDVYIITSMITTSYHALILGLGEPDRGALADNVWRFCLTALRGLDFHGA
jgi:AcrR family transcriptional regulator